MIDAVEIGRNGASPARAPAQVALVTCAELPDLDPDDRLLVDPLAGHGIQVTAAVWDDPGVDWASFDLVVLRSTWDYARRRDDFVAWAAAVPTLVNPADVVAWNTDKRYLRELAAAGVPVVPTSWVEPGDSWSPPVGGEWVIKPAVSAGSKDTGRYDLADPAHRDLATAHVARLQAANRLVMIQPYLPAVDSYGETAVLYLGRRLLALDPQGTAAGRPGPRRGRAVQGGDHLRPAAHTGRAEGGRGGAGRRARRGRPAALCPDRHDPRP